MMRPAQTAVAVGLLAALLTACSSAASGGSSKPAPAPSMTVSKAADCAAAVHGSVLELFTVYDPNLPNPAYRPSPQQWAEDLQKLPVPMRVIANDVGTGADSYQGQGYVPVANGSMSSLDLVQADDPEIKKLCEQAYPTK